MHIIYFLLTISGGTIHTTGPLTAQECALAQNTAFNTWQAGSIGPVYLSVTDWLAAGSPANGLVAVCKAGQG